MSASVRSLLIPAVAVAAAGAVALGPMVIASPAVTLSQPMVQLPAVHVEDLPLAGLGRNFYNDVTYWVQEGVRLTQGAIRYGLPYIGPPIADQIVINYNGLIQPVIADTVYYLSDVIANPLNFFGLTGLYGSNLFYTGYEWVNSQALFFGLPPLPFLPAPPPLASIASVASVAARTARAPRAAAAVAELPAAVAADPTDVHPAPARAGRGELRRATRGGVVAVAQAASAVPAAAQQAGAEVSAAARSATAQVRGTARAARAKAAGQARVAVAAAADAAN